MILGKCSRMTELRKSFPTIQDTLGNRFLRKRQRSGTLQVHLMQHEHEGRGLKRKIDASKKKDRGFKKKMQDLSVSSKTNDPKNAKIFFILGLFIMSVTFLGDSISGYINLETLDIYQSQE